MKKFVLFVGVVFIAATLIGCNKKKAEDEFAMDGLNGVVTENVISITNQMAEGIPVIIDNALTEASTAVDSATEAVATLKPTPKQIQQALKNAGFYSGKVDGEIGPKTKKAVEEFQSQNGLKADGKVGPKTWKALAAHLNKAVEVANPSEEAQTLGQ